MADTIGMARLLAALIFLCSCDPSAFAADAFDAPRIEWLSEEVAQGECCIAGTWTQPTTDTLALCIACDPFEGHSVYHYFISRAPTCTE